jgi:hypothetical protein
VRLLLPRRARGKAWDRLLIDVLTLERAAKKAGGGDAGEEGAKSGVPSSADLLAFALDPKRDGHIPHCFARVLARKAKQSLEKVYGKTPCREAVELGIRFDWRPIVDYSLANSVKEGQGKSHFVGHDDERNFRAQSVEKLAIEE